MSSNDAIKNQLVSDLSKDPFVRALCAEEGFVVEALSIVRFHDKLETAPWFYRDVETVGYIAAICDGGKPCDPTAILAQVRAEFGSDVSVLWPGR